MYRSQILRILARRLSNRDVEDIYEAALDEMEFVQRSVLERLPNQPWFLEKEVQLSWPKKEKFIKLPDDYNGLMTHGGVWIAEAILNEPNQISGLLEQSHTLEGTLVSPTSTHLVAFSKESSTDVYDVSDLSTPIQTVSAGGDWPRFSPDGEWLLVGQSLYETRTWTLVDTVPTEFSHSTSFSHDRSMAVIVPTGSNNNLLVRTSDWQAVAGAPNIEGFAGNLSTRANPARCTFTSDDKYLLTCGSVGKAVIDLASLQGVFSSQLDFSRFSGNGSAYSAGVFAWTAVAAGPHWYEQEALETETSQVTPSDSGAQAMSVALNPLATLVASDARGDDQAPYGGWNVLERVQSLSYTRVFSGTDVGRPFDTYDPIHPAGKAEQVAFTTDNSLFIVAEGTTAAHFLGRVLAYEVGTWTPVTLPITSGCVGIDTAARID